MVERHGKEALNFQITVSIAVLICAIVALALATQIKQAA